ncbi:hypothetical protein FRC12_017909 [Ceratobasidium sp. 428]|nr:hypothetical protein FRC12_017909 [Ceratobasidium sp. 428]
MSSSLGVLSGCFVVAIMKEDGLEKGSCIGRWSIMTFRAPKHPETDSTWAEQFPPHVPEDFPQRIYVDLRQGRRPRAKRQQTSVSTVVSDEPGLRRARQSTHASIEHV